MRPGSPQGASPLQERAQCPNGEYYAIQMSHKLVCFCYRIVKKQRATHRHHNGDTSDGKRTNSPSQDQTSIHKAVEIRGVSQDSLNHTNLELLKVSRSSPEQ